MLFRYTLLSLLFFVTTTAAAEPPQSSQAVSPQLVRGYAACQELQTEVNSVLYELTTTTCNLVKGIAPSTFSLIFNADQPVLAVPDAKQSWLLVVMAAVGHAMNEDPSLHVELVVMGDQQNPEVAYVMRGDQAKTLQQQMKNQTMPSSEAYQRLLGMLTHCPTTSKAEFVECMKRVYQKG